MKTYRHKFKVHDYCLHTRLCGRLQTVLDKYLFDEELKIEKIGIEFTDGSEPLDYDRENPLDACELLEKKKIRGDEILIYITTSNGLKKKTVKKIFEEIDRKAFDKKFYDKSADFLIKRN